MKAITDRPKLTSSFLQIKNERYLDLLHPSICVASLTCLWRVDIFRNQAGDDLVALFLNLDYLRRNGGYSIYRQASINLLIAELEKYLEDPTTPKMHIFQKCALQAHFDLAKLRLHGVKDDDEPAMALIEARIKKISATVLLARELYTENLQRKMQESKDVPGDSGMADTFLTPNSACVEPPSSHVDSPAGFSNIPHLRYRSPSNPKKESSGWVQPLVPVRLSRPSVGTLSPLSPGYSIFPSPNHPDSPTTRAHYRTSSALDLTHHKGIRRTVSSIITPGLGLEVDGENSHACKTSSVSTTSILSVPKNHTRSTSNLSLVNLERNPSQPPSRQGTPDSMTTGLTERWGLGAPKRSVSASGFHVRTGSYLGAVGDERENRPLSRMGTPFSSFFPAEKSPFDVDTEKKVGEIMNTPIILEPEEF